MRLKYIDGLMGFVVGDALGVPLEHKTREELLKKPVTKMLGYGSHNMPEGTWSDDTSMMIATIDSINAKCDIDLDDIALKFVSWYRHADYTPDKETFGTGGTCRTAIEKYDEQRERPTECGLTDPNSNGNGSLMRILPIAYYAVEKRLKEFEVLDLVSKVSSITHAHEISIMGCYIYTRFVMFLLNGKDKLSAYNMVRCVDYTMFSEETQKEYERLIKNDISTFDLNDIKSTGYVVDTLEACIWLILKSESYTEAVIGAINLGGDTDTIAALTGALAGILFGYETIPTAWIDKIARKDYLMDIFEEFSENKYE